MHERTSGWTMWDDGWYVYVVEQRMRTGLSFLRASLPDTTNTKSCDSLTEEIKTMHPVSRFSLIQV